MSLRRVVTGLSPEGRAVVIEDRPSPGTWLSRTAPGMSATLAWATEPGAPIPRDGGDPVPGTESLVPGVAATRLLIMRFPTDSVYASDAFDAEAFVAETSDGLPGLAERFEAEHLGMHATPSVDYAIVLDGTPSLELDDGAITALAPGDIVIQNGTRHAWRNPGDVPATVAMVLIGAPRAA